MFFGAFDVYLSTLLTVAFLYLFVCVDDQGDGIMARTKRFFWDWCPNAMMGGLEKLCGKKVRRFIERLARYICYEPNPIVQIIYFVCAFGGFYVYVTEGFKHLPNKRVSDIHIYTGTLLMIICYASYFAACWMDPGSLTKDSKREDMLAAIKRFKYDGVMFEKKMKCRTCNFEKPARSKHCSTCNVCVQKMDHHCVWINQCVGLYNYRFFLSFLCLHAVICTYGAYVGYEIMMSIVEKERLLEATFYTQSGESVTATPYVVFSYL